MSRQFQLKLALSFGLIAMLTGCASTHSHYLRAQTLAYLHSQSTPPTVIPPGLSSSKIDSYYDIPPVQADLSEPVSLLPPGSLAAAKAANH